MLGLKKVFNVRDVKRKFVQAVKDHDLKGVEDALAQNVIDLNAYDNNILFFIIERGTPEMLRALLKAGAHPMKTFCTEGWYMRDTSLEYAIRKNKLEMTNVLLEDPRTQNPEDQRVLEGYDTVYINPSPIELAQKWGRTEHIPQLEYEAARRFIEKYKKCKRIMAEQKRQNDL